MIHSSLTSSVVSDAASIPTNREEPVQRNVSQQVSSPCPVSLSDGHKTDSFSSSDALPDDVARLFDRASLSVRNHHQCRNSGSIEDPDGLRQGLNTLLAG